MSGEVRETIDAFHFGGFYLVQPKGRGHRAGMDPMLLASLVPPRGIDVGTIRIADLGAGAGAAGLAAIARLPEARVTLVERSPEMIGFARKSASLQQNAHLRDRIEIIEADVTLTGKARVAAGLADDHFDHVIMNPPFNDRSDRQAPDAMRAEAHQMTEGLFESWIRTAGAILKPGGQLSLIARPQSLAEVIDACGKRFGGLEITLVHPREGENAIRFLLTAIKGSRARPAFRFPLVMHADQSHKFAAPVDDLNNGRAAYARL